LASSAGPIRKAGRPSAAEAARIRETILDAAVEAFIEHGYGESTIDGIALRAQTTRRSIIHRFATKEDLLSAVVERQLAVMLRETEVRDEESDDLLEVMRAAFRRLLDYILSPASLGYSRLVMHEVPRIADIGARSIAWNEALVASYVRLILRAQEAGHFRRYSANTLAHMAIGVMLSNPVNRALLGDPAFFDPHRIDMYFSEMWAVFLTMA
jgi:AcrR family transcriptional regulator